MSRVANEEWWPRTLGSDAASRQRAGRLEQWVTRLLPWHSHRCACGGGHGVTDVRDGPLCGPCACGEWSATGPVEVARRLVGAACPRMRGARP